MTNPLQRWTPLPSVTSSFPTKPTAVTEVIQKLFTDGLNQASPLRRPATARPGEPVGEALHCPRRTEQLSPESRKLIHRLGSTRGAPGVVCAAMAPASTLPDPHGQLALGAGPLVLRDGHAGEPALAGANDVLVSSTLRDLVIGSGL